jgi:hypothetical protein
LDHGHCAVATAFRLKRISELLPVHAVRRRSGTLAHPSLKSGDNMAGIFLSWSSEDEEVVTALKNQLVALKVPIWEYRDQMKVGQTIHDEVVDAIGDSLASIICFSEKTYDKPWIQYELAWAYRAYGKDPRRILPVWVGEHPDDHRPALVNHLNLAVGDMLVPAERERLVTVVLPELLGAKPPLVMTAALFALTRTKAEPFFQDAGLLKLCDSFGMRTPPELVSQLSFRYGDSIDDFSPFENGQRLRDVIDAIVDGANAVRASKEQRPIFLRWMHDELTGKRGEVARKAARKRWRAGASLLVIDSISTLDADTAAMLNTVIERRSSILWIPPYTLHTNALSTLLRQTAERVDRIADALVDWQGQAEPQLALDAPTELSVQLWLHRAFVAMSDTPQPDDEKVQGVQKYVTGPPTLKALTNRPTSVPSAFK